VTALTSASDAGVAGAKRRPAGVTRLGWVTWRQHRATLIGLALFLAGLTAYSVLLGQGARGFSVLGCGQAGFTSVTCRIFPYTDLAVSLSGLLVPVVIGMFLGAPLLAREYAVGTARFAWTQSIGRTRQTLIKLTLLGLVALAVGAAAGTLAWWVSGSNGGTSFGILPGWLPANFSSAPVAEAASALLGYAAGVLAGALTRRVVPAMVATAATSTAFGLFAYTRLYYWALGIGALRTRDPVLGASQLSAQLANPHAPGGRFRLDGAGGLVPPGPGRAVPWLDQGWFADAHGQPLRGAALLRVIHQPSRLAQWHDTFWVAYQPASRYWLFQLVQGGVVVLLALILGALAVWLVRRRIA
jgi:hypothetical protein